MTTMMSLSSVIFLVAPGYDLASVYIFLTAQLGELGVASATTIKVIAIVVLSMGLLQIISKKTGLNVKKQGA
jgi:iron(III) transport system permease protein